MNGQTYCGRIIAILPAPAADDTNHHRSPGTARRGATASREIAIKGRNLSELVSAGMQGYVQASVTISIGQIDLIRNSSP